MDYVTIPSAKVGGPPLAPNRCTIVDLETGAEPVDEFGNKRLIIEVSAEEGWLIAYQMDEHGSVVDDKVNYCDVYTDRVPGRFEIRYPRDLPLEGWPPQHSSRITIRSPRKLPQ